MDPHAEPEHALRAVERLTGLVLTVHDLSGDLGPFIAPDRQHHRHPVCVAIRHGGGEPACVAFDITRVRAAAERHPDGFLKRCPWGLVELVMPLWHREALSAVIFAGVLSRDGLEGRFDLEGRAAGGAPAGRTELRQVGSDEADALLEGLRQLRARLLLWLRDAGRTRSPVESQAMARRDTVIQRFIELHHDRPLAIGDVARHLGLSPSRTRAVVRSACGTTFAGLLATVRLRAAADLLVHTDLSVNEVALRSGFGTASHFFRCFQAAHGRSPRAFRLASRRR